MKKDSLKLSEDSERKQKRKRKEGNRRGWFFHTKTHYAKSRVIL